MQNSQLIHILSSLSKKENRELRKWLVSPIHNQRSDVVQLYEYLTSGNRLEDDKSLEKERIFRKLYPKEAYDDAKMRQVIHFLQEAIEEYFIYCKVKEDPLWGQINLVKSFRERKLEKLYDRAVKKLSQDFSNFPFINEEFLEKAYWIEKEKSEQISKQRSQVSNYQEMSYQSEIIFIARKLKLACAMLSHQKIYKTQYDFGLMEPVLEYIDHNKNLLNEPFVNVYFNIYNLFKNPQEESYFYKVKQSIDTYSNILDPSDQKDIYLAAINYCIARMNIGHQAFIREAFELYRKAIENKIIIENNILNHLAFRNIVTAGTTLKEFDWVSDFINEYQNFLAPEYRENFVQFSLAKLHFEKGDYDQAQRLLIQFDIDDLLINLSAKSMLIKIYYEEGEINTLESLLESLRTYINRKKSIAYHKIIYNNLIRFTKKLVRLPPRNKALKERLRKQIEEANPLPERKWLLEQLDKI